MRAQAVAATAIAPPLPLPVSNSLLGCRWARGRARHDRDGGRHCEEERDHCANKGRPQRHEGDLFKDEGDAAGN
jgi:hypothetical protein